MSNVTATRLGSSPLRMDWSGLAVETARNGRPSTTTEATRTPQEAWEHLRGLFSRDEVGFYHAVTQDELSQFAASQQLAKELLAQDRFTDVLFLGIGGSALGPVCLLQSLEHRRKTSLKFHFAENPDPIDWKLTLQQLSPASTLVCAVTKSGGTFETIAQLLIALDWLGRDRWSSHLVAITDPKNGDLRQFARDHGLRTLEIAPSIGGRFSVFSPVGLFASEMAGLDTAAFLKGASQVFDYCEKQPLERNALAILAQELVRRADTHPIHVCMPYSTRLRSVGDWFVQLWGESLGKDGKGFTPVAAVGATDQHSILQLLRDGPNDKITWFVGIGEVEDEGRIPTAPVSPSRGRYASFALLEGHTLQGLLATEMQATSLVLSRSQRPQVSFQLDTLDERAVGALLFSWSVLTALTGAIWAINPFDQPGVEEGKVYTRESLKRQRDDAVAARSASDDDENSPVNRLRRGRD